MSAATGAGRDRLAVRERDVHGEVVAEGDWTVSDAERAAAGRETVTARFTALLPANRERAARRYAAGDVPEGEEVARVWTRRDAATLTARLDRRTLAAWADGDVLHVLWRGAADRAVLTGGIQLPLWPVDGAPGLWEASARVRRLEEAVISLAVSAVGHGETMQGCPPGEVVVFRGARAPADAPHQPLAGELHEHVLDSAALRGSRGVTVYLPPGAAGGGARPLPGCVLADGQSLPSFAPALEAAMTAGTTPPAVLVGVHNAAGPGLGRPPRADLRALEYLARRRSRRFTAHLSFVTEEVIPWAASRYGVAAAPWSAAGFSNGAAWAITAAQRQPDVFCAVAALSAGVVPHRVARGARQVRHYAAAGTLEPGFRRATGAWAARLQRAGVPAVYREWAGGHDSWWWHTHLPLALAWLLTPGGSLAG